MEMNNDECIDTIEKNANKNDICDAICGAYRYCMNNENEYKDCYYYCFELFYNNNDGEDEEVSLKIMNEISLKAKPDKSVAEIIREYRDQR